MVGAIGYSTGRATCGTRSRSVAGTVILVSTSMRKVAPPTSSEPVVLDPGTLAAWNQKILGSKMGEAVVSKDIPKLARAYKKGELKLDELVSKTYRLDQINEAIADTKKGAARRNVIVF